MYPVYKLRKQVKCMHIGFIEMRARAIQYKYVHLLDMDVPLESSFHALFFLKVVVTFTLTSLFLVRFLRAFRLAPRSSVLIHKGWYQSTLCRKRPLYYKGLFM